MRALISTIGNRDLELDGQTVYTCGQTMREFGQEVLARYDELKDRLRAPMLERALQYLSDVGELPDQLVLVVSDRPEGTPYRDSDTCYAGEVLATLLRERFDIQKKTSIKRLSGVPAMIDPVMRDLERWFPQWEQQYEWIYLMTTGGTPAMSTAMILCALQYCPDKVTPLYAPLGEDVRPTNVLQHTRAAQRRRDLCTAVEHGRFAAAVPLVPERAEELGIADYAHRTLRAILTSAEERLRFDLTGARRSLVAARREAQLSDEMHSQIALLHSSLPANGDIAGLLAELYHNAGQKLRHHEYADFVLRLFNFQQAALRHCAERSGVTFHRNGEYLTPEWLQAHPDFEQFVASCTTADGSEQLELQGGRATGPLLLCLISYLQTQGKVSVSLHHAAQQLQQVASLRNRCFAAHDFRTVGRPDLEAAFGGAMDEIVETMAILYEGATGRTFGPDPFGVTERLARELLGMNG